MFSQLSGDVVNVILSTLPDFYTLLSMISASKDINAVFETHPTSIIHSVANNQVGPALAQALRLVRLYELPESQRLLEKIEESDVLDIPITRTEAGRLGRNANVVKDLEALYSIK